MVLARQVVAERLYSVAARRVQEYTRPARCALRCNQLNLQPSTYYERRVNALCFTAPALSSSSTHSTQAARPLRSKSPGQPLISGARVPRLSLISSDSDTGTVLACTRYPPSARPAPTRTASLPHAETFSLFKTHAALCTPHSHAHYQLARRPDVTAPTLPPFRVGFTCACAYRSQCRCRKSAPCAHA